MPSARHRVTPLAAALALACLVACGGEVPSDPATRIDAIRRAIAEAETGAKATVWITMVANEYSVETRDLLLELLDDPRHMVSHAAAVHLTKDIWLADPIVRRRLIDIYTDPLASRRQRLVLRDFITAEARRRHPDLGALPPDIEMPPGAAYLAPPAGG